MIVTLIGYRGSGKSAVAGPLAERLGWPMIDADEMLEAQAGLTIREIFAQEGEAGFRRRERQLLHDLLQRQQFVLSAGGGAILNADTRREMREAGPVVWLQAPPSVLWERLTADRSTTDRRPALAGGGLAEVETILAQREPLYREAATICVDTTRGTLDEIVRDVFNALPLDKS